MILVYNNSSVVFNTPITEIHFISLLLWHENNLPYNIHV